MQRGTRFVVGLIFLALIVLGGLSKFFNQQETQSDLAKIDCSTLLPTNLDFQGNAMLVPRSLSCELLGYVATMQTNDVDVHDQPDDPWRYFGRLRIRPKNDVWFLVFMTRRSLSYKPIFSLRRQRGYGWSVVGTFDAAPIFGKLGIDSLVDMKRLMSDSALIPTDQGSLSPL
jgi:hypothetical protein